MTEQSTNRVLVLGRLPGVLDDVMQQLGARGVSARGSTDAEHAADQFDAMDFDLISFGGGVVGPLNERLRLGVHAAKFASALSRYVRARRGQANRFGAGRPGPATQYVADFQVAEEGLDYVLTATILQPCEVRIEVHQTLEAPLPHVKVVEPSPQRLPVLSSGAIDSRHRVHGHMLVMMLNDDECCVHRMQPATPELAMTMSRRADSSARPLPH